MSQIISILGTTASGKTALAFKLAKLFLEKKLYQTIDIISADSRQVYRELTILTGADIPQDYIQVHDPNFQYPFFQDITKTIRLHGLSFLYGHDEWSLSHFVDFAQKIIQTTKQNNSIVLLVGGTGLYHQQVLSGDPILNIKPNLKIREKAADKSIAELQAWLKKLAPDRIKLMNHSDLHNSRRLIRAIEVVTMLPNVKNQASSLNQTQTLQHLQIALTAHLSTLQEKIHNRVSKRFKKAIKEVSDLDYPTKNQIMTTLGVAELQAFLQGKIDQQTCLENWTLHEYQYAKRQITWIKKQAQIKLFEAKNPQLVQQVFNYCTHSL